MTDVDDQECIHGLGPISACTICNGREQREQAERNLIIAWFPARYASTLACGHDVEPGEQIAKTNDDRYLCADCAS